MNVVQDSFRRARTNASRDLSLFQLKAAIILFAIFVIALTLFVKNKGTLAGILAYEVLP